MIVIPTPWSDRALVIQIADADPRAWLSPDELEHASRFRLEKRRDEWILSRAALKTLAQNLGICDDPHRCTFDRPWIVIDGARTEWLASISHTDGHAAAIVGEDAVGIDVQIVRPIAESASHLFLNDDETVQMQRCSIADRVLHFWCAKEAGWKQRSDEFGTMRQLPLYLESEGADGLLFDSVETLRIGELIVAITR